MKQPNQVILCCGRKGCPVISKEKKGMIKITDDFGSSVLLKEDEARLIDRALNQLKVK